MDSRYDITLERWQAAQWAEQRENERSRLRIISALSETRTGLDFPPRLTSSQIAADLARYGHVALWRFP